MAHLWKRRWGWTAAAERAACDPLTLRTFSPLALPPQMADVQEVQDVEVPDVEVEDMEAEQTFAQEEVKAAEIKLFGKWSLDVDVSDMSLQVRPLHLAYRPN